MCIFQKSYALLGQTFSKLENRGSFLGPTFFGTFFCQKYRKTSDVAILKYSFWEIDKKPDSTVLKDTMIFFVFFVKNLEYIENGAFCIISY